MLMVHPVMLHVFETAPAALVMPAFIVLAALATAAARRRAIRSDP